MKYLYNAIYLLLFAAGLPWIVWRVVVQKKNRYGWQAKLFGNVSRQTKQPCIWVHGVSVGEINLLPKLVARLKQQYPEFPIAISSTTETGLKLAQEKFPDHHVFFCPFDFSWAVENALDRIEPRMLVLTELELWPNLISRTSQRDIPVVLINGRISESSFRGYRRIRFLIGPVLQLIASACVQTAEYRDRLVALGLAAKKITVTGNIKFDNAITANEGDQIASLALVTRFEPTDFIFVAGSTQELEDLMLIEIFDELQKFYPRLRLILVPRHPDRIRRIETEMRRRQLPYSLRSRLNSNSVRPTNHKILIVDVIGELKNWWQMAHAGFVGGSMGNRGGQNMIEPAAAGIPIAFGTDTVNFKDVVSLLMNCNGARVVSDQAELRRFMQWSIESPDLATEMGGRARAAVQTQQGALDLTLHSLAGVMNQTRGHVGQDDSRNAA